MTDLIARMTAIEDTEIPETSAQIRRLERSIEKEAQNSKDMVEQIGATTHGIGMRLEEIDQSDIQAQIPKIIVTIQMLEQRIGKRMSGENGRLRAKIMDLETQMNGVEQVLKCYPPRMHELLSRENEMAASTSQGCRKFGDQETKESTLKGPDANMD